MATATLTTDLTTFTTAESTTDWIALRSSLMIKLDDWGPIQGSAAVGPEISSVALHGAAYDIGSGNEVDISNTHIFVWMKTGFSIKTRANNGIRIYVGDGTNWGEWTVGGSDTYSGGWQMMVVDTSRSFDFNSGTDPTLTSIREIGVVVDALGSSNKVQPGLSIDVIRYGSGITVTGGTTSDRLKWADIAAADDTPAYGVLRKHNSEGIYVLSGKINIGDSAGSAETFFDDENEVIMAADLPVKADFYQINIGSNTTAPTTFILGNEIGTAPDSVGAAGGMIKSASSLVARNPQINSNDPDIADCDFLGLTIVDADTIAWDQPENRAISCLFSSCGMITLANDAVLRDSTIDGSLDIGVTIAADPATNTFRDMLIQNCVRGIEITAAGTYNFRNIKFSNNSTADVSNNSGGAVTINVLEGGDTPSIENVGASTTTVVNAVAVKVTTKDAADASTIQGARVLLEADTGGDLPFEESVSINRSGSTATVNHTSHGLSTGDKVDIQGADQAEYNGVHQITVTDADTYTYTVSGTPATPATGTIISTAVVLDGLTDVNGVIEDTGFSFTSNQPVIGKARKSTTSPLYKSSLISGTITSSGFETNTFMVSDE